MWRAAGAMFLAMTLAVLTFWLSASVIAGKLPRAGSVWPISLVVAVVFVLFSLPQLSMLRKSRPRWATVVLNGATVVAALFFVMVLFRENQDPLLPATWIGWLETVPWVLAFSAGSVVLARASGTGRSDFPSAA